MTDDPQVVALEALLRPFPGPDPSGRSLQYDPIYDQIKEARRADDPSAPRDIWAKDLKAADWKLVQQLCQEALINESKDLQVCAWLMEAWYHLDGLAGLRRGVELILQMSESHWETVHPDLATGVDFRVAPFVWINEKLPGALGQLPIVAPEGDPTLAASWDDWKRTLWVEKMRARTPNDPTRPDEFEDSISLTEFRLRCSKTHESFFRDRLAVLEDTVSATRSLEALLDDRLAKESPSLVRFRQALTEIESWTKVVMREGSFIPEKKTDEDADMADEGTSPDPEETESGIASSAPKAAPAGYSGPITGRADAYRMLLEAARYLKELEPHSPTPYLVLRAVSWGDMTLDDLLREFVREGLNLEALFTFLGIEPGDER